MPEARVVRKDLSEGSHGPIRRDHQLPLLPKVRLVEPVILNRVCRPLAELADLAERGHHVLQLSLIHISEPTRPY